MRTDRVDEGQAHEIQADEERRADLHASLNRRAAEALGKPFEGAGSSWHDIPECIASLRAALLASQESARSLAEALGMVLNRGTSGRGTALKVLRAYREAGREKP